MTEARASNSPRTVKFQDGTIVPAIGQGSWHLGEGRHPDAIEEEALRTGLSLGMTLIDTAEGYSNGRWVAILPWLRLHSYLGFLSARTALSHTQFMQLSRCCKVHSH